jgi:hypothetical protein
LHEAYEEDLREGVDVVEECELLRGARRFVSQQLLLSQLAG